MSWKKSNQNNQFISIPTLLIGPLYYIYNNISIGWILLVLSYFIYGFTHGSITLFLLIIRNIVLSFIFKYIKKQDKKMSVGLMIEIFIIHILIVFVISTNKPIERKIIESDHLGKMYYKVSPVFTSQEINIDQHFYVSHQHKGTCYITINYTKTNITEKEYLIKETSNISDSNNSIDEIIINDKTWYNRNINNILDIYITKYNNEIYELKFENTTKEDACSIYKKELLNSITFK